MGNGCSKKTFIVLLVGAPVDCAWNDILNRAYTCAQVQGGVGYDSGGCDENAVCAANTVVNQNSYCQCITSTEPGYSGNTFISDGASNVYYAASTDTCHDCGTITSNTDLYNGFAASNFYTGDATTCSCVNTQFRPAGGKCKCVSGTTALASNDPRNFGTTFSCVDCATIVSGPGAVAGTCGCTTNCNEDNACAANAIIDSTTNQCECVLGYTEDIDNACLICSSLQLYSLTSNPLGNTANSVSITDCSQPCSSLDKKPDSSGQCQCPDQYTLAASSWSSPTVVAAYDCIPCTSVTSGPGADVATCQAAAVSTLVDQSCDANAVADYASGQCTCITDVVANVKYLESLDGASCVSCQTVPAGDLLATSGDSTCACMTYAKPDTSDSANCACQSGYIKAGSTWDTNNAITDYECILCSALTSGPGVDVASCACAANAVPDTAGVCRCVQGYLTSLDGTSCVDCSSITTNDMVDSSAAAPGCACVTYAAPDTSTSDNFCSCQSGTSESHTFWDTDGVRSCIPYSSLTGIGADISTGQCGIQAYLKETGQCACLDGTATLPTGVASVYSSGADFCYRSGTTAECIKDATSGTTGLLFASCSATGLTLTVNEACRAGDYATLDSTKFYVGSNAASCQFSTQVGGNYVLDDSVLAFATPSCDITSANDGTFTTYSATLNYDSTGVSFTITAGTVVCKIENANTANVEVTQIDGWSFEIPDYSVTIDQWDGTGMPSIVTMNHNIPNTNTVNLGDIIALSVNEVITNVFNYRIDKTWISTSGTLTDFDTGTDPKFLIVTNGCPTVPCWAEIKSAGMELEFHAVKFSTANSIYLYSQIYLCTLGNNCDVSGSCTACGGSHSPTGRRRKRSSLGEKEPVLIRQEIQFDREGRPRIFKRAKAVQAPYNVTLLVPEELAHPDMLHYYEHY